MTGLLQAEELTRRYGKGDATVVALRSASLSIEAGDFLAITGPSGSGKSTLMNLIGLLDRPSSGRLVFMGEEVTRLSHDRLAGLRNRDIGFVFQAYNLLARYTALENVELPLIYTGMGSKVRIRRAKAALAAVNLAHRAGHLPSQLSGGEQQRVSIARAIVNEPALILADEPTGALDSRSGAEIMAVFRELNEGGATIVMITHDAVVASHAARSIEIKDGLIVGDRSQFADGQVRDRDALQCLRGRPLQKEIRDEVVGLLANVSSLPSVEPNTQLSDHAGHHHRSCLGDHDGVHRLRCPDAHCRADSLAGRQCPDD